MKYLLDTVAWLWSVHADERLGDEAREILANGTEEIYLSAASSWELSIKMRLGKLNLPGPPGKIVPAFMEKQGLLAVAVTHLHAAKVYDLPLYHSDPFDRLIIAQAMVEEMAVLTSDRIFEKYPIDVIWCGK
jgi:PIN domain nuclease of toxin-antitoxin system